MSEAVDAKPADPVLGTPVRGPWRQAWRRFAHHRAAVAAGFFLILLVLAAILADSGGI